MKVFGNCQLCNKALTEESFKRRKKLVDKKIPDRKMNYSTSNSEKIIVPSKLFYYYLCESCLEKSAKTFFKLPFYQDVKHLPLFKEFYVVDARRENSHEQEVDRFLHKLFPIASQKEVDETTENWYDTRQDCEKDVVDFDNETKPNDELSTDEILNDF